MRKAVKEFDELIGKTIEGVFEDGWMSWNCRVLTFTDGTYAAIVSGHNYDGDRDAPEIIEIEPNNESHVGALVAWGVMSKEDQDNFMIRINALRAQMNAEREKQERATYERLHAK